MNYQSKLFIGSLKRVQRIKKKINFPQAFLKFLFKTIFGKKIYSFIIINSRTSLSIYN